MASDPAEIKKRVKLFVIVGVSLLCLTGITVWLGTTDIGKQGFDGLDIFAGLLVALCKASLVALIFMHLNHEAKTVYQIIGMCVAFTAGLYFLTLLAIDDHTSHVTDTLELFPNNHLNAAAIPKPQP